MLNLLILVASIGVVLFAFITFRRFRSKRPTAGAVFAVLALFFLLGDLKFFQFHTMMSTKPPMPVETVTSAVVKEEDWAPTLSAVGSISAVQGAVVSTELPGTVAEIAFQSGAI